jgi:hypothetical protein
MSRYRLARCQTCATSTATACVGLILPDSYAAGSSPWMRERRDGRDRYRGRANFMLPNFPKCPSENILNRLNLL